MGARTDAADRDSSASVQSVHRALDILHAFQLPGQELSVGELAVTLGVHKSTISRLASTLVARGFLERTVGGLALGAELGRLGALSFAGRDLVVVARPDMQALADEIGETINLIIPDGHEGLSVAQVDGHHLVGVGFWTGRRTELHCSATGKVLLAFAGSELRRGRLERFTANTVTDRRALRAELDEAVQLGWAQAVGELEIGMNAVAAPIYDATGTCAGAISISGPEYRMPGDGLPAIAQPCKAAAARISSRLASLHGKAGDPSRPAAGTARRSASGLTRNWR